MTNSPPCCFFERHGVVQRDDGALGLVVGRRLGGDALQPEAGRGHQGEQRSAMLGGEADDLVRDAGDHRQQHDAHAELGPERGYRDHRDTRMYTMIEISITVIRKLVPQRGWNVEYFCTAAVSSGSPFSKA